MQEILSTSREQAPKSRFIGIRYGDIDREGGGYAAKWAEWFQRDRFGVLDNLVTDSWKALFPEAESRVGLMRIGGDEPFEYWIGMFLPPETPVPEGYESMDFAAHDLGVCFVKGSEPNVYMQEETCLRRLKSEGYIPYEDEAGAMWVMERYQCPRFTEPDAEGQRILDLVFLVRPEAGAIEMEGKRYCGACFAAFSSDTCPECGSTGTPLQEDDPIFIGELPGPLRNALQISFQAIEIPFTALPTKGQGFTMAAGDILETYMVYVPFERAEEAKEAFQAVLSDWRDEGVNEKAEE